MKLSNAQIKVLQTLSKPWNERTRQHPCTSYNFRTREVLLREGLVEIYNYSLFLHGAIRLTPKGKEYVKNLESKNE